MPSSHLILCRPLLLLTPIPPSIRVFSNQSTLRMRWPKYWSFSFSISPSNEHPGLISFRMDWLDLLAVQGALESLLQHHSSKASVLWRSAFFIVQISYPYMTTGKTIALTRQSFVGKVMSLLLNMLSRCQINCHRGLNGRTTDPPTGSPRPLTPRLWGNAGYRNPCPLPSSFLLTFGNESKDVHPHPENNSECPLGTRGGCGDVALGQPTSVLPSEPGSFLFLIVIYLFLAAPFFTTVAQASVVAASAGCSLVVACSLLIAVASLLAEHRLSIVAHRLSCSAAGGIFSNQGSNPCLCIGGQILNHRTTREVSELGT